MNNKDRIKIQKSLKKRKYMKPPFGKTKFSTVKSKVPPSTRKKGSAYFNYRQLSYRLPIILLFASLLMFILVVPSLIVMPLGKKQESTGSEEVEVLQEEDEAISVAVMRTQSEVVEDVPLESYIIGVVAAEMPADFEMEALKAQALAARTYTVSHLLGGNDGEEYDITDTVQHQVYKNPQELMKIWGSDYEGNMEKIKAAVEATKGEILTYNNKPIMPAYFSMSNGYTENSEDYWENELPYLRSVPSPWERNHPKFVSQETFTKEELETYLEISLSDSTDHVMTITRTDSNRVSEFTIAGTTFTGREVREKLGLRSSDFSVEQRNDHFIFTTKGNGHGVGMSQFGADYMAKEGKTYKEIVEYYYKDVEITTLDEAAPTLVLK